MSKKKITVTPVNPSLFQLSQHGHQSFDAMVPSNYTKDNLEDPALWSHVSNKVRVGDEIRVLAEDGSFYVLLMVVFIAGSQVKTKVIFGTELEVVDPSAKPLGDFEVKMRGTKKWCVVNRITGEVVEELIPTQAEALRAMSDLEKALKS